MQFRPEKKTGFALVYALLASVAFLVFFLALTYSVRGTLVTTQQSEQLLKGRVIASSGNNLLFQLVQSGEVQILGNLPFRFSNRPGPDYFRGVSNPDVLETQFSADALGGYFDIEVQDSNSFPELDFPSGGTYLISIGRASVGQRHVRGEESSRLVYKMGSPFLNFLALSSGGITIRGQTAMRGPVMALNNDSGQPGTLHFIAHEVRWNPAESSLVEAKKTVEVSSSYKAQGSIAVVNLDELGNKIVQQDIPRQTLAPGDEITVPPLAVGLLRVLGIGGIHATSQTQFEPNFTADMKIDDAEEFLAGVRGVTPAIGFDLDSLSAQAQKYGLLVECEGSTVSIFEVRPYFQGRTYDLAILESLFRAVDYKDCRSRTYLNSLGSAPTPLLTALAECRWNDPAFQDAPIPLTLRQQVETMDSDLNGVSDLSLADIPSSGDYVDHYSVERGTKLHEFTLSGSTFQQLRFTAATLSSTTAAGEDCATPIYIRGEVDGKLSVLYELQGAAADAAAWTDGSPPNRIYVLVDDGISGVKGGLALSNPQTQTDSSSSGPFSDDFVLLCSNGGVLTAGLPAYNMRWLCGQPGVGPHPPGDPAWENHRDFFGELLAAGLVDPNKMSYSQPHRTALFQGMAIDARRKNVGLMFDADLNQVGYDYSLDLPNELGQLSRQNLRWQIIDTTHPVSDPLLGLVSNQLAALPLAMRQACNSHWQRWTTEGAHNVLGDSPVFTAPGEFTYDFRWRDLDAATIQDELGLTVTPLLLERRGL